MNQAVSSVLIGLHAGLKPAIETGVAKDMEAEVESLVKSVFTLDAQIFEPWTQDDGSMFRADEETVRKAKAVGDFDGAMADMSKRRAEYPVWLESKSQALTWGWQYHRDKASTRNTAITQESRDQLVGDVTEGILGMWPKSLNQDDKSATVTTLASNTGQRTGGRGLPTSLKEMSGSSRATGSTAAHSTAIGRALVAQELLDGMIKSPPT
jgi:hypothetical protein